MQFGTNHLGHFLLTKYMLALVEKGANKRIVNLSSLAHHRSQVDFGDPHFRVRAYDKWVSYGQSKTANILFSVALQERLAGRGFDVFAVRSEEHTSELQSLMRISYAVFCLKKTTQQKLTS